MLKEFWEHKKHLIQLVGILTGIGALFLSINLPENLQAREALANIQFVWLCIITISTFILFLEFMRLSIDWEATTLHTKGINFVNTISYLVAVTQIFLIYNLWMYLTNLYNDSILNYFWTSYIVLLSIMSTFIFVIWRKVLTKIPEKPAYKRVLFSFLISISLGVLLEIFQEGKQFSFFRLLVTSLSIFALILLKGMYDSFLRKSKPFI